MANNNSNVRQTAARAFVRSLNILLKFARMYDFGHPRTAKQYETAWTELRTALGTDDEAGLLLAVSGDNLLLDGTPLESAAAEKSFARMLSAAGIASIHFSPKLTHASLSRFVRGFPTGSGSKPVQLAEQLKAALQGDPHIHVNEVCFVPADSAVAKTTMAAQIAARTLGMNSEQTDELLNDPEKLLQLIVAAEGTKGGGQGPGAGPGNGPGAGPGGGSGSGSGSGGSGGSGTGWSGFGGSGVGGGSESGGAGHGSWRRPGRRNRFGILCRRWIRGRVRKRGSFVGAGGGPGGGPGDGSDSGPAVEGPVAAVYGGGGPGGGGGSGSGTWNIVGGTGSGTPVDPNAGGFWLNKDDSPGASGGTGLTGVGCNHRWGRRRRR